MKAQKAREEAERQEAAERQREEAAQLLAEKQE